MFKYLSFLGIIFIISSCTRGAGTSTDTYSGNMSKPSNATYNYSGEMNPPPQTSSITLTDKTIGVYVYSGYTNKPYSGAYSDKKT